MEHSNYFLLYNGVRIPKIGFGTWQIPDGEICYNAVADALRSGYRHIDTARAYANEVSVGQAIRDSGIERNNIFITSKLPAEIKTYEGAWESYNKTMDNLGCYYLDLYLIHAPWPWAEMGSDYSKENIAVWKAMEEIYKGGRCRAIGISNFNVNDITAILNVCEIKPMVNQIKYHIGFTQEDITTFCLSNGILIEGYSPFATGRILGNKEIGEIACKYDVTVPQICIKYILQKRVLPLPKSVTPERMAKNLEIDFEISAEDINFLDSLCYNNIV